MRFNRLHLLRYGCFTDYSLTFDAPPDGGGDFHLIYGPNEAGKSTIRDACIDFLYGIPARSKYNFLHDYAVMAVGAEISASDSVIHARRSKGNKQTLTHPENETVIPETRMTSALGGMSADGYRQIYSLDDTSLAEGGESILSSEGDLGTLLFSAASGLSGMSSELDRLREETEKFFKSGARNRALHDLKAELKKIEERLKEADVDSGAYKRLCDEAKRQETEYFKAKKERDDANARIMHLTSLQDAYPVWEERKRIREKLTEIGDVPAVPKGWDEEVSALLTEETKAKATESAEKQAMERADKALKAIVTDNEALEVAEQVERLNEGDVEARYKTSQDIERRRQELAEIRNNIKATLKRMRQSESLDTAELFLPTSLEAELHGLIDRYGAIEQKRKAAQKEWEEANAQKKIAEDCCKDADEQQDMAPLERLLKHLREEPDPEAVKKAEEAANAARRKWDKAVISLNPWQGDASLLTKTPSPDSAQLRHLIAEEEAIHEDRKKLKEENDTLGENVAVCEAEITSLLTQGDIISDEKAAASREARDHAWRRHREMLESENQASVARLKETAEDFAGLLKEDDGIQAVRLGQTQDIVRLREAQKSLACEKAKQKQLPNKQSALETRQEAYDKEQAIFLQALGLPAEYPLTSVEVWGTKLEQAKETAENLATAEEEHQSIKTRHDTALKKLKEAIRVHAPDAGGLSWQQNLELCQILVDHWKEKCREGKNNQQSLGKAQQEEGRRKRELDRAIKEHDDWQSAWSDCLSHVAWMDRKTPDAVKALLSSLDDLKSDNDKAKELERRIAAMTEDRRRYAETVAKLAQSLSEEDDDRDPLATADRLRARVRTAQEAKREQKKASETLSGAEKRLRGIQDTLKSVKRRFTEMTQTIPADSLTTLQVTIRLGLEYNELKSNEETLAKQLMRLLKQESVEDALSILQNEMETSDVRQNVETEYVALESDSPLLEDDASAKYHDWQSARKLLNAVSADDEPAKLQERKQELLLRIADEAHRFMQRSAGIMLADEALRMYRIRHRHSMMKAASDAFAQITRGAFQRLEAMPSGDSEILMGIRKNGSSITTAEMSTGTRNQLYLALRIAGHAEFAAQGETLPFFADDIFETFDDERSQETFKLLHEMSKRGQVIYLTHHKHLCEMAQSVCGNGIHLHELPDQAVLAKAAT